MCCGFLKLHGNSVLFITAFVDSFKWKIRPNWWLSDMQYVGYANHTAILFWFQSTFCFLYTKPADCTRLWLWKHKILMQNFSLSILCVCLVQSKDVICVLCSHPVHEFSLELFSVTLLLFWFLLQNMTSLGLLTEQGQNNSLSHGVLWLQSPLAACAMSPCAVGVLDQDNKGHLWNDAYTCSHMAMQNILSRTDKSVNSSI